MTTTFKGIEPPLPLGGRSLPPPPPPTSFQQPPRSWPRQTPIPDANALTKADPADALQPPLKKPKLEDAAALQRSGSNVQGTSKPVALDHVASTEPDSGVQQQNIKSRTQSHPLVPLRPGKSQSLGRAQRDRPIAIERAGRKDAVPIKAYVPEPPSCAPRYHGAGTYHSSSEHFDHTDTTTQGRQTSSHGPETIQRMCSTRSPPSKAFMTSSSRPRASPAQPDHQFGLV